MSTGGWLLHGDHLMIDGSPEVTQDWGAKEMFSIQQTSWNQQDASELTFNPEEELEKEHETACRANHLMVQEVALAFERFG